MRDTLSEASHSYGDIRGGTSLSALCRERGMGDMGDRGDKAVQLYGGAGEGAGEKGEVLLEETFYILSKRNTVFRVRLTDKGLSLRKECNGATKEQSILREDIYGCRCLRSKRRRGAAACACSALPLPGLGPRAAPQPVEAASGEQDESDVSAYLYIYAYVLKAQQKRRQVQHAAPPPRHERTAITLRFRSFDRYEDNNREAQKWRAAIRRLMTPPGDERKLLILLNPKSGAGKARSLFQRRVAPLLQEAEVPYELQVTRRAHFAREFVRTRDLEAWRAVVAVGGDGIAFEIINGIMERPDWQHVLQHLPLGVLPCGSGNGLARSVAYQYREPYTPDPLLVSSLPLVRGHTAPMDLVRVETATQVMYSFLSVGWGLLSDIDIESESLRAIGRQRFTVWSVARLIGLRTYKGKVWYQPCELPLQPPQPPPPCEARLPHSRSRDGMLDCPDCSSSPCAFCRGSQDLTLDLDSKGEEEEGDSEGGQARRRLDSWYSAASGRSAYFSSAGSEYLSVAEEGGRESEGSKVRMYGPPSRLPALTQPPPASWRYLQGEFILVHAGYQAFIGEDVLFAPQARLADGIIWLLIIRGSATRSQLLSFLLGLTSGAHALGAQEEQGEGPVLLLPVTAFRIEPDPRPSHPAHLTVDGELVAYGPVQAEVCPHNMRLLVPPG